MLKYYPSLLKQNSDIVFKYLGKIILKDGLQVFNMAGVNMDADQRLTQDLEKLTADLSSLVTGMVKPTVDILW